MPQLKFDRVQLDRLLKAGKKKSEIAKIFGVSPGAITHACKELRAGVCTAVALEAGHKILDKELNVIGQLQAINKNTLEIIDGLMEEIRMGNKKGAAGKDLREIVIKANAEIRQQLNFQMEQFDRLLDYEKVAQFQKTVIEIVGKADFCTNCGQDLFCLHCGQRVGLKHKIVERFKEAKALSQSVQVRP